MYFHDTNIINNPKLQEMAINSKDIFLSRGVRTNDLTMTQFRLLAYWGLFHGEFIEDTILFIEDCADCLMDSTPLIDAAVFYMNANINNLRDLRVDHALALATSNRMDRRYVLDLPHVKGLCDVVQLRGREAIALDSLLELVRTRAAQGERPVDFNDFARYA